MKPPPVKPTPKQLWLELLDDALRRNILVRLSLAGASGGEPGLKKVLVRPIVVRAGPCLSFVYRYATRDITKNFNLAEGRQKIDAMVGSGFHSAHLATTEQAAELTLSGGSAGRLRRRTVRQDAAPSAAHDREKQRMIQVEQSPWLRGLGVTTADDRIAKGMEAKFRQIQRFVDVLRPLLAALPETKSRPLEVVDMGCGKGYLTFATYDFLRRQGRAEAKVRGVEARPELIELCNRVAREHGFQDLCFEAGIIETATLNRVDILIALHACDTATDDAIARGIRAGASVIIVAPCCHKEVRAQLRPPPMLASTLRHGILLERQAEFATDALRAALLEWAGYETKVFEFVSPEHTNKNLMITAVKRGQPLNSGELSRRVLDLAGFYGISRQRLADQLGFQLGQPPTTS